MASSNKHKVMIINYPESNIQYPESNIKYLI